ncbi:MAG TPA: hypothetical protein VHE30_22845 [Polyangiaceae bacterium]|nr:hypothetical protein [Polyangiaceae bacterium]
MQRAVRAVVVELGLPKRASCHTLRHSFARWIDSGAMAPAIGTRTGRP